MKKTKYPIKRFECMECKKHMSTISDLSAENLKLKRILRNVDMKGWKSKDKIIIEQIGTDWQISEHRKDKLSGEVAILVHTIPERNVSFLWELIKKHCKNPGSSITYRQLVPSLIELGHFPIELEEFNGGKNRSKYYFKFYYYPIKILEFTKFIRYGSRGKILRLK